MEVLSAILCDSAADYNGKLCILGAFDTIWAKKFPVQHPHCALAVRLLFREADKGEHTFHIAFIDPDGQNILPQGGPSFKINIQQIPEQAYFLSRNVVINLQGLPLKKPAQYSFDIKMDNEMIARIPLQIVQKPEQASGS